MKKSQKKLISAAVFIGLAVFVTQPMHYPAPQKIIRKVTTPLHANLPIVTFNEMDDFLALWSEYLTKRIGKAGGYQISLSNQELKKSLPRRTTDWIENQNWEVRRFFYVEQRLRSIIKAADLKNQGAASRENLQKRIAETEDKETVESLKKLLEQQENLYKIENVTEGEINMVQSHLEVIKDILNGKVFYRPERPKQI